MRYFKFWLNFTFREETKVKIGDMIFAVRKRLRRRAADLDRLRLELRAMHMSLCFYVNYLPPKPELTVMPL
ncbi:hypothetical protein GGI64_001785 [Rhizobium leguminosarum]|uniref:Uncharacterized protein n=1 Tax=Rhizobium leguminosarum TaxID=384 RepID=A0A7Z0DX57_RHILE|nr:hypothetical protein [Rhizobium leguminosarum]